MDKQEGPQQSDQMDALEWGKSSGKRNVQQTHNGCRNRHDVRHSGDDGAEPEANDSDPRPDTGDTDGPDATPPEVDEDDEEPLPTPVRSKRCAIVIGGFYLPSNPYISTTSASSLTCPNRRLGGESDTGSGK